MPRMYSALANFHRSGLNGWCPAGIPQKTVSDTPKSQGGAMLKFATILVGGLSAMGGWAVVTGMDVPEYFVAGQQYTIEFQVRQHGRTLLNDLHPSLLIATSEGKHEATVPAVARPSAGTYAVTFTAPNAERVFLTIKTGFMNNQLRLYRQSVVAAGGSRPAMTAGERGQILFVAKGCNTCHSNIDLSGRPDNQLIKVGPDRKSVV